MFYFPIFFHAVQRMIKSHGLIERNDDLQYEREDSYFVLPEHFQNKRMLCNWPMEILNSKWELRMRVLLHFANQSNDTTNVTLVWTIWEWWVEQCFRIEVTRDIWRWAFNRNLLVFSMMILKHMITSKQ